MKDEDVEPSIDCNAPIRWQQLESLLRHKLRHAREQNDRIGADLATTEAIRGEIRCLKDLLDLPNRAAQLQPPLPPELT